MDEMLEKLFLTELQKDLIEDRKREQCQADPIYYGISDYHEYICPEEHADNVKLYDEDSCEYYTTDEYFAELSDTEKQELYENSDAGLMDDDDGNGIYIDDDYAFANCIEDWKPTIHVYYTQDVHQVEKDLFFLTRKSANAYLKKKGCHHTKYAHSYAMTACGCWQYEHLLKLLKSVNWKKSKLVFKDSEESHDKLQESPN